MKDRKEKFLEGLTISREKNPGTYQEAVKNWDRENGLPWIFNQVIGWLCLYVIGTSIKAEYYYIDVNRINRHIKSKRFLYKGRAFELNPRNSESSTDIYNRIRDKIIKINSKKPFKGYYIDLEKFDNVGPYINWRAILNFK